MVLFRSVNVEQIHKLLVTDDPYTDKIDRKKEVKQDIYICLFIIFYFIYRIIQSNPELNKENNFP